MRTGYKSRKKIFSENLITVLSTNDISHKIHIISSLFKGQIAHLQEKGQISIKINFGEKEKKA